MGQLREMRQDIGQLREMRQEMGQIGEMRQEMQSQFALLRQFNTDPEQSSCCTLF